MKRIRLTLSIFVASVLGCAALNSAAATASPYQSASSCSMQMIYCLAIGNTQAYCQAQYDRCCQVVGNNCGGPVGVAGELPVIE